MLGGAAGLTGGLSKSIQEDIKSHVDSFAAKMNLVPREDLERVETVLEQTRKMVEEQEKRIQDLESKLK